MTKGIARRTLGPGKLSVSAVGLGCMGMSDFYGPAEQTSNLAVLNHALDIGVNFWDSADMYGMGRNEELLAQILKSRRNDIVIATKFGFQRGPTGEYLGVNGRPDYIAAACDASLKRLGVAHIDLYYQHRVDPQGPIEDSVGAMAKLVEAGKVRYLGLSEASGETLRRAMRVHTITALQSEYSLWSRDIEQDSLQAARELGVSLVAYSPLGRGFLTGAIQTLDQLSADDWRRQSPRFMGANFDLNRALVAAVTEIAKRKQHSAAQLALAWLLHQGPDIVPIPGTRSVTRLNENAAAAAIELSAEDLRPLDLLLTQFRVEGARYAPQSMTLLNG